MIYLAPQYQHWFSQNNINNYKDLLKLCTGEIINNAGKNSTWRDQWHTANDNFQVYIKRYEYASPSPSYMYPRQPRAVVEMRSYRFWQEHNISGPEVIAAGSHSPLGFHQTSIIITREIAQAQDLINLTRDDSFRSNPAIIDDVFTQLAEILAAIHQAHFYHYDLHFRNIMVQNAMEQDAASTPKVYLIDCPRGKHKRFASTYLQVKDLACIYRGCYEEKLLDQWQRFSNHYYQVMNYNSKTIEQIKSGIRKRLDRRSATRQHGDEHNYV